MFAGTSYYDARERDKEAAWDGLLEAMQQDPDLAGLVGRLRDVNGFMNWLTYLFCKVKGKELALCSPGREIYADLQGKWMGLGGPVGPGRMMKGTENWQR